jgi:hypothetical protein
MNLYSSLREGGLFIDLIRLEPTWDVKLMNPLSGNHV